MRKYTAEFDALISAFLAKHPGSAKELKTSRVINGVGKWSNIDPNERKQFLTDMCAVACRCVRIYPIAMSMSEFAGQCEKGEHKPPFKSHWLGSALFIASMVQQRMAKEERNKGLTVLYLRRSQDRNAEIF